MMRLAPYRNAFILLISIVLGGCGKTLNDSFTLWRKDKIPYGTYYSFEQLKYIFSGSTVVVSKTSPALYSTFGPGAQEDDGDSSQTSASAPKAYIVIGNTVRPSEAEVNALFSFIAAGNQVFISAVNISTGLLDSLGLATGIASGYFNISDSLRLSVVDPVNFDSSSFVYPGRRFDNYFSGMDTSVTAILGKDSKGRADFVKIGYSGGGAVFIHLAPAAFTNFFLLHKQNKGYFDKALSHLPQELSKVIWDDYFRTHMNGDDTSRNNAFSKLRAFLKHDSLRWAFWLALLLFALVYFFDSKRKQRTVPVIPALKNTSLDFVQTIGRLYYQKKNNQNLAGKMSAHFLEHVRNRYNLQTSTLDDEFIRRLTYKSGCDQEMVRDIVYKARTLEGQPVLDDDELLAFSDRLDQFYQHK